MIEQDIIITVGNTIGRLLDGISRWLLVHINCDSVNRILIEWNEGLYSNLYN